MTEPTTPAVEDSTALRLVRPGVIVVAGALAIAGAYLAWLSHPAWVVLAVLGGLILILTPDPAS